MNISKHWNEASITNVCPCCGFSFNDDLKGPYDLSPYRTVCKKCWSIPFLHFPDKTIGKDGLSYTNQEDELKNPKLKIWNGKIEKKNLNVLLIEPNYYSRYPPLGLLKLSALHKSRGDNIELVRFPQIPKNKPNIMYVTSLFTYSWRKVYESVQFYKNLYSETKLVLGGIYASLLPDHAMFSGADYIYVGLINKLEYIKPDYSLIKKSNWDSNILFSSRGCIRKCGFCAVPKLEGGISARKSILNQIDPCFKKIVVWDNNILATPNWRYIFNELEELGCEVDFNQGFDARLITQEVAERISNLKTKVIRLAFDNSKDYKALDHAISYLSKSGIRKRKIVVYSLFNYNDTPEDFVERVKQLLRWGVVTYPMRYEPLCVLTKNKYISPNWNAKRLSLVQRARRVIGFAGSFPPYKGLVQKFHEEKEFEELFELRPSIEEIKRKLNNINKEKAELVYAYYKENNLTTSKLSLETVLDRISGETRQKAILNKRKKKKQKRLRGSLDWRSAS